ncbi:MAG: hypothetical protein P4L81_02495, partial [Candidatus Pacebacteria bacterium]|nr:hypothetical protein [Candidatus Paceibacterota bacterium]
RETGQRAWRSSSRNHRRTTRTTPLRNGNDIIEVAPSTAVPLRLPPSIEVNVDTPPVFGHSSAYAARQTNF